MSLWWSKKDINQFEGDPFRLNNVMSLNRFQAIDKAMRYTNCPPPTDFVDRFHDISQLQDAFNTHYTENYIPSYLNCLDKSMKTWLDQKCPGFMALDCKPHPFGNEYHTIADGDDGKPIVWQIKIQDGKDCPMTPDNKHSGFCVSAGILALHDKGVYGQALNKKRWRYWPRGMPADDINIHFESKIVCEFDSYQQKSDGEKFLIHCHKEDKYVCKIMSGENEIFVKNKISS
eukprot:CCRYP_003105-RA/>CCRYP_003105-RA protein AED:0.31 eAED:0.24 QI:0/0/0/1/0/0/2/0/230